MVFYNWILLTLLFLLSTFLYFVGFFLPCTICVHNHFFVKRHYFYATIVFCWIQPFEVFLKGLGSYNLSRMLRGAVLWSWHSEPEERTPKGCCWNLCGGRVLLGTRPETSDWEGPSLSHFQSPSRENQSQTEHPLARLCGEEFAPRISEKRRVDSELRRTCNILALSLALESLSFCKLQSASSTFLRVHLSFQLLMSQIPKYLLAF